MSRALSALFASMSSVPSYVGLPVALLGIWALCIGSRFRRPVAVLGGAFFGAAAGYWASTWIVSRLGIGSWAAILGPAAVLAVLGGLVPAVFPAVVGAMAGALASVAAGRAPVTLTFVGAGGVAGVLAARLFAAIGSAVMGASLLAVALRVLGGQGPARFFARYPLVLLAAVAVLAVAGAAFQHRRAWPKPDTTKRGWPKRERPPEQVDSQADTLPMR